MPTLSSWLNKNESDISDLTEPEYEDADLMAVEPIYLPERQREILDALMQKDFFLAIDRIEQAERDTAVDYRNSRIGRGKAWHDHALFLLAERHPDVLSSMIDLTLPQRYLVDPRFERLVRIPGNPKTWDGYRDPVIYAQYIADKNGRGLSCADMKLLMGALSAAAGLESDPNGLYTVKGVTIQKGINNQLTQIRKKKAHGFLDEVDKAQQIPAMEAVVEEVVKIYTTKIIPEAQKAGIDHVMLRPEVGWSAWGYKRCLHHSNLTNGSPPAFRLAQLVARHLFPTRGFRLHQFILFDVVQDEQAGIGESVGSILMGSYWTDGGWNVEQAGISQTDSWTMTAKDWKEIQSLAHQKYLTHMEDNINEVKKTYSNELEYLEKHFQRHHLREKQAAATHADDEATDELERITDA
ncbi:hypothetical protein KC323_g9513, partial [Hortaea werneckii]